MRNVVFACLLTTPVIADDIRFTPIDVPNHVYDGGWEHFVGGGLAVFDCNGDTQPDMIAAGGTNPLSLFRNTSEHDISFVAETIDITGVSGAYPIDLDGDAHLDLVLLRVGPDQFLRGNGDCSFSTMSLPGVDFEDQWTTAFSATWEPGQTAPALAFGHYVDRADPTGPFEACDTNTLWRPAQSGYSHATLSPGHCALSILFTDWDRSGHADLRVSNDRHYFVRDGREQLWAMETPPRLFAAEDGWSEHKLWGMGIATRDIDRDGRDEVFLSSMGDQRLMRRQGDGPTFVDVPFDVGTAAQRPYIGEDGRPSTGWHIAFGDIQNDGREDVFIAKGNVQQMPGNAMEDPNNLLIQQLDGRFKEHGDIAGVASLHRARGAALVDFNNDGLLDLAVVNRRAAFEVWQNTTKTTGHWLSLDVKLDGTNTHAIGAFIEVEDDQGIQSREITIGGGHAGGSAVPQHFGLAANDTVRVRVRWPQGEQSDWIETTSNQRLRITKDGQNARLTSY
ncbi:MAG: CRTAC1 family protein [Paracoccaceae bacterium]